MATKFGKTMKRMGRSMSLYVTAPLMALGGKAYKVAMDYESSMALLQIATGGTVEEMADLKEQILAMTQEVPMSFVELAELMTTLAQADVPVENLSEVAKIIAALGATSDVGAEESAKGIMQFLTVLGESPDQVEKMASALLDLGNKSVSTGSEIFEMAQRLVATGNLAGLSAPDILALSAAFASMGIRAEAGGTSASKLMKEMQLAAETGSGAKVSMEQFAEVMGVSAEEFKSLWGSDPASSMLKFFDGLAKGAETGDSSVLAMLDSLELTEVRMSNLIASAASNPDFFYRMLATGSKAWEENTSLAEASAYGTAQSQQDVMMNKMENTAADAGENIVELMQPVIKTVTDLVGEFSKLDEATQTNWVKVAGALIILGTCCRIFGHSSNGRGRACYILGWDDHGINGRCNFHIWRDCRSWCSPDSACRNCQELQKPC